jgi:hypothetical protein
MLVPVTARILFGVVESTLLVVFMVPTLHAITSDFRRESASDAVVRKSIAFFKVSTSQASAVAAFCKHLIIVLRFSSFNEIKFGRTG